MGILTTRKEDPSATNRGRTKATSKTTTTSRQGARTSNGARTSKGGGQGRRPGPRTRPRRDWPVLPIAIGAVFLVAFVALIAWYKVATGGSSSPNPQTDTNPVANIQCQTGEQVAVHYHSHLTILYHGTPVPVSMGIGIPGGQTDPNSTTPYITSGTCFYWLHTHDQSGEIHIEAPQSDANRQFTLANFFAIWHQPLSKNKVATISVGKGDQMKVWVDGQPYSGDPSKIVLKSHEQIVIEVGPPFTDPPPTYTFPAGE